MEENTENTLELERLSREELIEHVRALEKLVFIDVVTGLPNKRALERDVNQAIADAIRYGESVSILFIDLDGFKPVNDGLGHQKGDEALRTMGSNFRNLVRASDNVYRIGGDEFAILARRTNAEGARSLGEKLQNHEYEFEGKRLGLSFGIAQYGPECLDLETMLREADIKMYENKGQRRFPLEEREV